MQAVFSEIEDQCFICFQQLSLTRKPMMTCPAQHVCCQQCLDTLSNNSYKIKCSECRKVVSRSLVKPYDRLLSTLKLKKKFSQKSRQNSQASQISDNKYFVKTRLDKMAIIDDMKQSMRWIMCKNVLEQDYKSAKAICKKLIQVSRQQVEIFQGYGCKQHQIQWKQSRCLAILKEFAVHKLKVSNFTYDFTILAVCCMYAPSEDDKLWYETMLEASPNDQRLLYGLALCNYNIGSYNRAQNQLVSFINFNQNCSRSYEVLALIMLKDGRYKQALKNARLAISKQKNNQFRPISQFLHAKCNVNLNPDKKMEILQRIVQKAHQFYMAWGLMGELQEASLNYRDSLKYYLNAIEFRKAKKVALKTIQAAIKKRSRRHLHQSLSQMLINDKLASAKKLIVEILNIHRDKGTIFDCSLGLNIIEAKTGISIGQIVNSAQQIYSRLVNMKKQVEKDCYIASFQEWKDYIMDEIFAILKTSLYKNGCELSVKEKKGKIGKNTKYETCRISMNPKKQQSSN